MLPDISRLHADTKIISALAMLSDRVNKALLVAHLAHQGYTYDGAYGTEPYINHIQRVLARTFQGLDFQCEPLLNEDTLVVACLHDTLEDTALTEEEIQNQFGARVTRAVRILTHNKDANTYMQYIRRVLDNEIARKVKEADLLENLDNLARLAPGHPKKSLKARYHSALALFP